MNSLAPEPVLDTDSTLHKVLLHALSLKRPHGSLTTQRFSARLRQFAERTGHKPWTDKAGNVHVDARQGHSKTLFVAHVDTVHGKEGANKICVTDTAWYASGDVLGADDGAGVAMLVHLLENKVPGYYIFTQGEERGGVGARHLADEHSELLVQFDRAIAFDRRGLDSIISHQGWGRCCSDVFANALADALNDLDMDFMYAPDDSGIYTDTAEFVDYIPECTNISVGYFSEHTQEERLNITHYAALAQAALALDWEALPVERDPKEQETLMPDFDWSKYKPRSQLEMDEEMAYAIECLEDARGGYPGLLIEAMAYAVCPDNPEIARGMIRRGRITSELCDDYLFFVSRSQYIDAADLLCDLFDEVSDM